MNDLEKLAREITNLAVDHIHNLRRGADHPYNDLAQQIETRITAWHRARLDQAGDVEKTARDLIDACFHSSFKNTPSYVKDVEQFLRTFAAAIRGEFESGVHQVEIIDGFITEHVEGKPSAPEKIGERAVRIIKDQQQRIERLEEALTNIDDIAHGYDGYDSSDNLKRLIDELVGIAAKALQKGDADAEG